MKKDKFQIFLDNIKHHIPKQRIFNDSLSRIAFASDASAYRLIPRCIVKVMNEDEARAVISLSYKLDIPLTFRGGGTSLSGQSISDSVLMIADRRWNNFELSEDKIHIAIQPAALCGDVNRFLKKYNLKIGPDPASLHSATIGGIAANNSSGMTSGVETSCYKTLVGMRIIFSDGTLLDTADKHSVDDFLRVYKKQITSILNISKNLKNNKELTGFIKRKYNIKNTTGYGLNSLIDFSNPVDIISHLLIGSEGTLGFISQITLKTLPEPPFKATAFLLFDNLKAACSSVNSLSQISPDSAEIMNSGALNLVKNQFADSGFSSKISDNSSTVILEISADSEKILKKRCSEVKAKLKTESVINFDFIFDETEQQKIWNIRKGLFPRVCIERKPGSVVLIEDVNFRLKDLADAAEDISNLIRKYKYGIPVLWGHANSGNLHFILTEDFSKENNVLRYKNFMDDLAYLVIKKYNGSLKAEHGTGRNIAPFIEYEWGGILYEAMKQIKEIFDKKNLLNPNVIISSDKQIHLKNFKPVQPADDLIDKCIGCGFCEKICPSKNLTLTPRQRITVWREIKNSENAKSLFSKNELLKEFDYKGIDTCATDGLCALECPAGIDTGELIKKLRNLKITPAQKSFAGFLADNISFLTTFARNVFALSETLHKFFGNKILKFLSLVLHKITFNKIPLWEEFTPVKPETVFIDNQKAKDKVVYFPSCVSRTMGAGANSSLNEAQTDVIIRLLKKAEYEILYPKKMNDLCCGQPFESKGYFETATRKSLELYDELVKVSQNGTIPILFDTSPCSLRMKKFAETQPGNEIKIYDSTEFIHSFLLNRLKFVKTNKIIALHINCSSRKMQLEKQMKEIAESCAEKVIIPEDIGCCGFAGDKGFRLPELNESALENLKDQIDSDCNQGFSTSRTCEIGLTRHSGIEYKSLFYLLDECTGGKNQ
ncbi:MAG: FAD-binding oxidoreductase [Ignavibacteria bacterium]|nr:FAD-binding oxidoreductase [Ignavibacteria bacterium]